MFIISVFIGIALGLAAFATFGRKKLDDIKRDKLIAGAIVTCLVAVITFGAWGITKVFTTSETNQTKAPTADTTNAHPTKEPSQRPKADIGGGSTSGDADSFTPIREDLLPTPTP